MKSRAYIYFYGKVGHVLHLCFSDPLICPRVFINSLYWTLVIPPLMTETCIIITYIKPYTIGVLFPSLTTGNPMGVSQISHACMHPWKASRLLHLNITENWNPEDHLNHPPNHDFRFKNREFSRVYLKLPKTHPPKRDCLKFLVKLGKLGVSPEAGPCHPNKKRDELMASRDSSIWPASQRPFNKVV